MAAEVKAAFKKCDFHGATPAEIMEMLTLLMPGTDKDSICALVSNASPADGKITTKSFLKYILNGDGQTEPTDEREGKTPDILKAERFLHSHGIYKPSQADIDYVKDNKVAYMVDGFVQRMIKDKPYVCDEGDSLNRFSADYFSGALAQQKRLVLIASNVENAEALQGAVRPFGDMGAPIVKATYNFEATPLDLKAQVESLVEAHGMFKTIALCCHNMAECGDGKWHVTASHGVCLETGALDGGVEDSLRSLTNAASVRLDIMACSLASTEKGIALLDRLQKETKTNIASSLDITGNPESGGNWVLETDGINMVDVYFDAGKILSWEGTLGRRKKRKGRKKKRRRRKGRKKKRLAGARRARARARKIRALERGVLRAQERRDAIKMDSLRRKLRAVEEDIEDWEAWESEDEEDDDDEDDYDEDDYDEDDSDDDDDDDEVNPSYGGYGSMGRRGF